MGNGKDGKNDISKRVIKDLFERTHGKLDELFYQNNQKTKKLYENRYGTNQSMTHQMSDDELTKLAEYVQNKYQFSYRDARNLVTYMDSMGICTNAAFCNAEINKYGSDPVLFKEKTGLDLYKNKNGEDILNLDEILIDFYISANEGMNIYTNTDGSRVFDGNIDSTPMERSLDKISWFDGEVTRYNGYIDRYLASKGNNGKYTVEENFLMDDSNANLVISKMQEAFGNGKSVNLRSARKRVGDELLESTIKLYDENGNVAVNAHVPGSKRSALEGGNHIMTVTGMNEYGIMVDSWGKRYFITYQDLIENKGFSNIEIVDIIE